MISSATATHGPADEDGDNTIVATFDNLLPCTVFFVNFLLHYNGTIPAHLSELFEAGDDDATLGGLGQQLIDDGFIKVQYFEWLPTDTEIDEGDPVGSGYIGPEIMELPQVHECDWIKVVVAVHIPQEYPDGHAQAGENTKVDYSGKDGSFECTITATQWND